MQFTRQPIIETIITPKEGYKLQVKGTRSDQSDYQVDALELVLFGTIPFYRSLEGLSPFLVPAADFTVEQMRETRAPLKHATYERAKSVKESQPRDAKKSSSSTASKDRSREPKRVDSNDAPEGDAAWERRKRSRRRSPTDDSATRGNLKVGSSDGAPPSYDLSESDAPTSPGSVKTYDLVPPPTRFVSEVMNEQGKEGAQFSPEPRQVLRAEPSSLDAVEAILRSSAPDTPHIQPKPATEEHSKRPAPIEPPHLEGE